MVVYVFLHRVPRSSGEKKKGKKGEGKKKEIIYSCTCKCHFIQISVKCFNSKNSLCFVFLFPRRISSGKEKSVSLKVCYEKGVRVFAGGDSREDTHMACRKLGKKKSIKRNN